MNLDNDLPIQFKSELLFEASVEGIELFIFDNKVNYTRVPPFTKLTLSVAKSLRMMIIDFYEGNDVDFCNIIEFKSTADIDPEAREWGANRPDGVTSISDAMIIGGMAHKMIANFYLKMNRPSKPSKFFTDLDGAINWSLKQLDERT